MSGATTSVPAWHWHRFAELPPALLYDALRLRSEVFVVEQDCVFQDMDGLDQAAEHLCGTDRGGALLAYARLLPPGLKYAEPSLGRVVTALAVRRQGLGRLLMHQALDGCRSRFPGRSIRIGAQRRLQSFYADFGFATVSAPYLEDGIWHIEMLAPAQ